MISRHHQISWGTLYLVIWLGCSMELSSKRPGGKVSWIIDWQFRELVVLAFVVQKRGFFSLIVIYTQTPSLSMGTEFDDRYRTVLSNSWLLWSVFNQITRKAPRKHFTKRISFIFWFVSESLLFSAAHLPHLIDLVLS